MNNKNFPIIRARIEKNAFQKLIKFVSELAVLAGENGAIEESKLLSNLMFSMWRQYFNSNDLDSLIFCFEAKEIIPVFNPILEYFKKLKPGNRI